MPSKLMYLFKTRCPLKDFALILNICTYAVHGLAESNHCWWKPISTRIKIVCQHYKQEENWDLSPLFAFSACVDQCFAYLPFWPFSTTTYFTWLDSILLDSTQFSVVFPLQLSYRFHVVGTFLVGLSQSLKSNAVWSVCDKIRRFLSIFWDLDL